jgi:hypothetical protein
MPEVSAHRGTSARGRGDLLVHLCVWAKLGEHGSSAIGARGDVPKGEFLAEVIGCNARRVNEAARSHDRPGDVIAGEEEIFHTRHIFIQAAPEDIAQEGEHDAVLKKSAHLGRFRGQASAHHDQAPAVIAEAHASDDFFGFDGV